MEIVLYKNSERVSDSLEQFINAVNNRHLLYFSSDLINRGLSIDEINEAVLKAIIALKSINMDVRQHFQPLYTQYQDRLIKDCKLSKLGMAFVLLNADSKNMYIARIQLLLAKRFSKFFNERF